MARLSHSRNSFKPALIIIAVVLVAVVIPTPHTSGQSPQDDRQLQRDSSRTTSERRTALVIGNGAYTNAPPLKNPPNDARDMASTLKTLGFDVTSGINVNQRDIKRLIREFGQALKAGGSGLFYYAGHGVQSKGRNYLIPIEADIQSEIEVEDAGVDVNLVLGYMDDAQNGLNIVILDACRDNPFARSFRSATNGLAQVDAPTGTLIAYATAPGRVASDGTGQNGLYTSELLKQMRVPRLSATEMFMHVRAEVMKQTANKQVPWEASSLVGNFYFSAPAKNGASPPPSAAANEAKIDPVAVEREYWETIRSSSDAQDYKDYLQAYPNGVYAAIARAKIRQVETAKNTRPTDTQPINTKTSGSPSKSFRNQQGIEMVYIPSGRFMMGSNARGDEQPVHEVTISQPFYMGKFEVTQGQWQAVMGTTLRQQRDKAIFSWTENLGEGATYPMYYVSWEEAKDFVRRLNALNDGYTYRLPSESEWEYACRAGTVGEYAGDLDSMAWYTNNSGNRYIDADSIFRNDSGNYTARLFSNGVRTHPVGTKQANGFGLYDMLGNVSEWCEDWWHSNYSGAPTDGSPWLSQGEWKSRVSRGGSWGDRASVMGSAHRSVQSSTNLGGGGPADGFRVVAVGRTQ